MKPFLIKWHCFFLAVLCVVIYYATFINKEVCGDLGSLGRIPFTNEYDVRIRTLDYTDNIMAKWVDVDSSGTYPYLLIGDSFTEPENALSHILSKTLGDTVAVICDITAYNYFEPTKTLIYGLNNHCFRPGQTIILESIGRYMYERFAQLDFNSTDKPDKLRTAHYWREQQASRLAMMAARREECRNFEQFDLNGMLSWIRISVGYKSPVRHCKLDRKFFDNERYGDDLFYYNEELAICDMPQTSTKAIADGVNNFFRIAEEQGITLYLFMSPDKSDLYYPYMAEPETSRPNVQDFLKDIDPRYMSRIINSRDTLAPYLERGELDIFRCNDGHWSIYAAEEMGRAAAKKIKAAEAP